MSGALLAPASSRVTLDFVVGIVYSPTGSTQGRTRFDPDKPDLVLMISVPKTHRVGTTGFTSVTCILKYPKYFCRSPWYGLACLMISLALHYICSGLATSPLKCDSKKRMSIFSYGMSWAVKRTISALIPWVGYCHHCPGLWCDHLAHSWRAWVCFWR